LVGWFQSDKAITNAGFGAAGIGTYQYFGGWLNIVCDLSDLLSRKMGTAFAYFFFGAFWFSVAATLHPANNA